VPTPKATTTRCGKFGPPNGTASGTDTSSREEATSAAISTGRRPKSPQRVAFLAMEPSPYLLTEEHW